MSLSATAKKEIAARFRELYPKAKMHEDRDDHVADPRENLLDIRWIKKPAMDSILKAFEEGGSGELKAKGKRPAKFNATYSTAALTVNSFGPWLLDPGNMTLGGISRFRSLEFEKRMQVVPKGGEANLDLFAFGFEGAVALESTFLELLDKPFAEVPFKAGYDYFRDKPNCDIWYEQVKKINNHPDKYRYLDARQLISRALALVSVYGPYPVKLLYLFWEPENAPSLEAYRAHRQEIEAFKTEAQGATVQFESMSYSELWETWSGETKLPWLRDHVEKLRARYLLSL